MSAKTEKATLALTGFLPVLIGVTLIGTAGIRGFDGTGGSDTPLFQQLTYTLIPAIIGGTLAMATAIRPNRNIALISGVLLILSGLFLILLVPLNGILIIVSGVLTVSMSRSMSDK